MTTEQIIEKTTEYIKQKFENEGTGHDWFHIDRVRRTAMLLAIEEGADTQIVELAALLHDVDDWKFNGGDVDSGPETAKNWILELGGSEALAETIKAIVNEVTFKGAGVETKTSTLEAAVVQDADRLDALGAIGIARAFAYGGSRSRLLWDPEEEYEQHESFDAYKKNTSSTIAHFHEKLLLLKDRMQTVAGKQLAEERHNFMVTYLDQFEREWWGDNR
ncbi:HD domain-containing protein [Phaeocystidibacter luteus]|uniref:HD domain-containing protein n=1 Tax=Phaeocystidibacter luteus TaxID=911197 RepID=A0A6N6RDU8_9FLAO|nr:HD domain-containing protein [Phaeocystidibacter luteus]KAB2807657.1 HD domain-containing protein [Phaeocystidibacter luteus]